jgi:molybdate transport system substrate-binding protein
VSVQLSFEQGLDLRRTIAQLENKGSAVVKRSPIHLVAPGGDELLTRLAQKQYVQPETRTLYATRPLVLVVPESLVDAPASFASFAQEPRWRIAVADPLITPLGQETAACLESLGIAGALADRLDVAVDAIGVLDRVLRGEADMGILFGPDAVQEQARIRVAAMAPAAHHRPRVYSMAMERNCPDRLLCKDFLSFLHTKPAREVLKQLGYGIPQAADHD